MKDGCKPKQSMGGRVTAVSLVTFLLLSMISVSLPVATHLDVEQKSMGTSSATITFSNGPVEDETFNLRVPI